MKKWVIGGVLAIVGILAVCTGINLYMVFHTASSVPIIGGMDLETALFLTEKSRRIVWFAGGLLALLVIALTAIKAAAHKRRGKIPPIN